MTALAQGGGLFLAAFVAIALTAPVAIVLAALISTFGTVIVGVLAFQTARMTSQDRKLDNNTYKLNQVLAEHGLPTDDEKPK